MGSSIRRENYDENWKKYLLALSVILTASITNVMLTSATSTPSVTYKAHIQSDGWIPDVKDGMTAGSTGQLKRLEALTVTLLGVMYRTHISEVGWQEWKTSGQIAGTSGKLKAIEAVEIKLTGDYAKSYNIYYRVHVSNYGWLGWATNGATAGSTGLCLKAEAIEIKLVEKSSSFLTGGIAELSRPSLTYQTHIQGIGWMIPVAEDIIAGTTDKSLRLEALKDFNGNNGIIYCSHVANIGWQNWVNSGQIAGTTEKAKAIEAVQIKLSSSLSDYFDIYYRVHSAYYGWLGWAKNGAVAGTYGGGIQAEAIQIKLVNKGEEVPVGGIAYYELKPGSISSGWAWPTSNHNIGNTYPNYSNGNYHGGADFAVSSGTPVYSSCDGTVASVQSLATSYGKHITIDKK